MYFQGDMTIASIAPKYKNCGSSGEDRKYVLKKPGPQNKL